MLGRSKDRESHEYPFGTLGGHGYLVVVSQGKTMSENKRKKVEKREARFGNTIKDLKYVNKNNCRILL